MFAIVLLKNSYDDFCALVGDFTLLLLPDDDLPELPEDELELLELPEDLRELPDEPLELLYELVSFFFRLQAV